MLRSLNAWVALRQGALALDVRFELWASWTCLFGASGSGKSTVLRVIAGMVRPELGRIVLRGGAGPEQVLFDRERSICQRTDQRGVRMAGQQAWLFPGSVGSNLACGMVPVQRAKLVETARRFRIEHLLEVDVRTLSGGERQRVSLARAVASAIYGEEKASLLLLDEPFAGMDGALRDQLAIELRDWLAREGIPVLSVTHDVGEAFLLGAEVIRLVEGKIAAQGPVGEVLRKERQRLESVLGDKDHAR